MIAARSKKTPPRAPLRLHLLWVLPLLAAGGLAAAYASLPRARALLGTAASALLDHSYFSVHEITVKGGERIGGSEIVAMAGLSHGMNLWKIDSRAIERNIARHPWVKRVSVRREFPHRVVVVVEERVPRAIAVLDRLYYVDEEGKIFKEVKPGEKVDLPFLTGLSARAAGRRDLAERIQEALELHELLAGRSLPVSEIRFSEAGLTVYPVGFAVPLRMGWGRWHEKLDRFEQVRQEWKSRLHAVAAFDLSFRQQIVVQLKKKNGHG
jgi:hypothetical protein